jgi:FkbM family methyltransferase
LIVDTRRLFCRLLRTFDIATVCDVGSMDGRDALRFRRALPTAGVIALEPNPRNFALMQADERLRQRNIRILPLAASDRDSEAPFFVVDVEYVAKRNLARRGMSSLHRRPDSTRLKEVVQVRTIRLDSLLAHEHYPGPLALWIDTEGMAFETVSGATGVLGRTVLVHVEVETIPCIGADQSLFPAVERVLLDAGFALLATDDAITMPQFNALFVRADCLDARAGAVRWHVARGRMSRGVKEAVPQFVPARVRRFLAARITAVQWP